MSVINDTLKALELRGGRGAMPQSVAVPTSERPSRRQLPVPALLLVVLGLAIAWVWWPTLQRVVGFSGPVKVQAEPAQTTSPSAPQPEVVAPEQAEIAIEAAPDAVSEAPVAEIDAVETAAVSEPDVAEPQQVAPEPEPAAEPAAPSEPVVAEEKSPVTEPAEPVVAPTPAPELAIQKSALSPAEQALALWRQAQQASNPEPLLEQALELDPYLHDARLALLALLAQRGEADAALLDAARRFPQEAAYPLLAAELSQQQGEAELAQQWLAWASRLTPDREWRARRAGLAQQLGQLTLAQQDYQALLDAEPQRGTWWFGLGYARDAGGDLSGAVTAYQQALSRADLSPQARAFIRDRLTVLESQ